jgi:hypothetical protein
VYRRLKPKPKPKNQLLILKVFPKS